MPDRRGAQDTVICIGAGPSQMPYLEEVKRRQYRLVCVDADKEAPGFSLADDYIITSTRDVEETPKLIIKRVKEKFVAGVISPCTGLPYATSHNLRKLLGRSTTSAASISVLMDKLKFRKHCNNIGVSNFRIFNGAGELNKNFFPLLQKRRFGGMGGQGVHMYLSLEEYHDFTGTVDIDQNYVYEGYIHGKEMALDAIWDGNRIIFLNLGWTLFETEMDIIIGSTSQVDAELVELELKATNLLNNFCSSLQLGPEVLNVDIIVDSTGMLHIVEAEFVPADGIPLVQVAFGFDFVKNYVSIYIGDDMDPQPERRTNAALVFDVHADNIVDDRNGTRNHGLLVEGINYFPVKPYSVPTKIGTRKIEGYYIISNDSSEQLTNFVQNTFSMVHPLRYNYVKD